VTYYQVSDENLAKVENYFVNRVKDGGSKRFEATVIDIADGSGVALATAHKAIKQLAEAKIISIIKPNSRRFPISYTYLGDIEGFEQNIKDQSQIEYLQHLVAQLQEQVNQLESDNRELVGENRVLRNTGKES
jgi:predicted transcriptional regulator